MRNRLRLLCALAFLGFAQLAAAQAFPNKVIRLIVPWPPGGGIDIVARTVFQELPERLGQQVIVDNRAGANGFIGTTAVAKSDADGYTLLFADVGTISISPAMRKDTPYDSIKDFEPVSQVVSSPFALVVHPKVPANTLQELVAYAKSRPGKMTYGSFGNGSIAHLAGAMLLAQVPGLDIVHVPYKGAPPAITDLIAGQIDMLFLTVSSAAPHIEAGRLRGLGVTTLKRSPVLPNLPAIAEIYPGFEVVSWYGVLAPAGTPKEVVARLNKEIVAAVQTQKVHQALVARGFTPEGTRPEQFAAMIRQDVAQWAKVVKAAKLEDTGR
jgi:tripartite-type tricarboxylate transporter receptor subunit TctC